MGLFKSDLYRLMKEKMIYIVRTLITYDKMYLNCAMIGIVYTIVSIAAAMAVIRKQDYK